MDDELRTLTSHAGLLPHHSSGEEKSDGSTARSFSLTVYPKDRWGTTGIGVADIGLQTNAVQFDGIDYITVGEEVEVAMGRIDRLLGTYEI